MDGGGLKEGTEIMKRIAFVALGVLIGFTAAIGLLPAARGANDMSTYRQLDLFSQAFDTVRKNYVRPVQDSELVNAAIDGMVTGLDPHSSYMDPKNYADMQIQTKGEFGGVGIEVTMEDGLIKVISPIDDTPAARAGLKTGDLIVAIDGQLVDDPNAFDYRFATKPLGGTAQIGVIRSGKEVKLTVALETAPDIPRDEIVIKSRSPFLGVTVANLSPALADELRLDASAEGVVIIAVADGSAAETLGFQRGDLIVAVNNQRIAKTRDLERVTRDASRQWRITIVRGGQQVSVVLGGL